MSEASLRNNVMAQRIRNKMGPRVPNIPRRGQTAVMGEINKSIEKMSIGEMGNGKGMKQSRQPSGPPQTTALMQPNRRDSNWTVSTEGYGSMRSNTSTSRRCSELSQVKLIPLFCINLLSSVHSSHLSNLSPPDVSSVRTADNAVACLGPDLTREQQTQQRGRRGEDEPGHEPPLDEAAQEGPRGWHHLQLGSGTVAFCCSTITLLDSPNLGQFLPTV